MSGTDIVCFSMTGNSHSPGRVIRARRLVHSRLLDDELPKACLGCSQISQKSRDPSARTVVWFKVPNAPSDFDPELSSKPGVADADLPVHPLFNYGPCQMQT